MASTVKHEPTRKRLKFNEWGRSTAFLVMGTFGGHKVDKSIQLEGSDALVGRSVGGGQSLVLSEACSLKMGRSVLELWLLWSVVMRVMIALPIAYSASSTSSQEALLVSRIAFGSCANQSAPQVIGTWDDHDYGLNDAGKEFNGKITSQRLLLDFLDEPQDSPRRKQAGVYTSYTFGPVDRQIKVILLDTRYHRDPLFSDGSILGSSQWTWLESELKGPASALTIIGSSIQVISNLSAITGPIFYLECWGRFPKERERLFKLIADSKVRDGVFFISGDVHFGEITRYDCATGYPLFDITASGITQAVEKAVPPPLNFIVRFVAWLAPTTMRVMGQHCRRKSCTYGQPNFGAIEIDWDATPVTVKMEVRDVNGFPVLSVNTSLLELQAQSVGALYSIKPGEYRKHCSLEVTLPWIVRHRLAILFFCALASKLS
ncbi:hypothetical protein CK203_005807 [Vitis vinifera]|uniref:PhoD-like phosphatase metallophosphatase domain-containing protein n=1 Tax=Vitis vinifera TaxID=29760 RepID=A0A438K3T9_VITVI|nr:hypothetical protein CK203_005807 [Vitis vinifera]